MRRIFFFCTLLFSLTYLSAQNRYSFRQGINTPVFHGSDTLLNPWAGGLNYPTLGEIDLNGDGTKDLLAYDRSGYRLLPLVVEERNGEKYFRYRPEYLEAFPLSKTQGSFLLLRDFNCDGKNDLFYSDGNHITVFENTSQGGQLSFQAYNNGLPLQSRYNSGSVDELYISRADLPNIADVDGDGDIDIQTFGVNGVTLEYHQNFSSSGCDFNLVQTDDCWGDFVEGGFYRTVQLNGCSNPRKRKMAKVMHAGSAILTQDINADGINDLWLTNVSYNNLSALINGGTADSAVMISQDTLYPPGKPVDLYVFPAPFYADATFDGIPDLLVTSYNNSTSGAPDVSSNHNGIWLYRNDGAANQPSLTFREDNFLQGDMIDFGAASTPRLADLNGDGLLDLVLAIADRYTGIGTAQSQLFYYENTGTASRPSFTLNDTNFADMISYNLGKELVPTFGDLDADGDLDMIVGSISGYFHQFENTGTRSNPQFTLQQLTLTSTDVGADAAPYLYDVDQDGDLDLFVGNERGRVYLFENSSASQANFSLKSSFFGAIDATQNLLAGSAKPVLFRDSLGTAMFVGSTNSGVIQYDAVDTVFQQPAQIVATVGDDHQPSANFEETPFGISKRSGRNQFLVRASELQAAGLISGFLEGIWFYVTDPGGSSISNGLTIKAKNTTDSVLNGFVGNFPQPYPLLDRVQSFGPGWNRIDFSQPFLWDGKSNLVFDLCFRRNFPAQDVQVGLTNTPFPSHAYGDISGFNTLQADGCVMPYKNVINRRPDLRFTLTPAARQVPPVQTPQLWTGFRTSPDFGDLNNDGFIDAVVGNQSGGLNLFWGRVYDVSLPEPLAANRGAQLSIYPNPATDRLFLEQDFGSGEAWRYVRLVNLSGQTLWEAELREARTAIELSQFPTGLYLLSVEGPAGNRSEKLLIQRRLGQ